MQAPDRPDQYLEPYRQSHRRHGAAFEVTCWASPRSQRLRFEVFTQMCPLADKRILDAGCSRGDLAAYLVEMNVGYHSYVGVDALGEVIEFARSRKLPRTHFLCGDLVTRPDLLATGAPEVICISGTFNTMADEQIRAVLEAAWAAAGETLMFNFLSDRASPQAVPQSPPVRRLDPLRMLRWAFGRTPLVALRQDYFSYGHDATILMRKE